MAFPPIENTDFQSIDASSSPGVSIPVGWSIASGDWLLIILFSTTAPDYSVTPPEGWNGGLIGGFNNSVLVGIDKEADGTEAGTTVNIGLGTTEASAAAIIHMSGVASVQYSSLVNGDSTTPNSPSFSPTFTTPADIRWFSVAGMRGQNTTVSAYPTNYSDSQGSSQQGSGGQDGTLAVSSRELNASSEDPAAYEFGAEERWGAATIAVEPSGGGTTISPNNLESLTQLEQTGLAVSYNVIPNDSESLTQLEQSGLSVSYSLSPNALESLTQLEQSGISVLYGLSPNSLESITELEQSGLILDSTTLSPNDLQSLSQLQQSGLTPHYVFSPNDAESVTELEQSAIDVLYSLLPNSLESLTQLEQSGVSVAYGLSPNNLETVTELGQAALTPHYIISPSDLESITELESTVLGVLGDATKMSLSTNELYVIDLRAKKLYTITTNEKEIHNISLNADEVIE